MTLNFPGNDTTLEQAMEAVATQWKDNLGIDVTLNPITRTPTTTTRSDQKMTGPWWDGWVEDYPSLQDYLTPIYGKNGGYNGSGYDNKTFDDMIRRATSPRSRRYPDLSAGRRHDLGGHAVDPVGLPRVQHGALAEGDQRREGARLDIWTSRRFRWSTPARAS